MFKSHVDPGLDPGDAQDLNQRRSQTTIWKEWVNDDACAIPASRQLRSKYREALLIGRHNTRCELQWIPAHWSGRDDDGEKCLHHTASFLCLSQESIPEDEKQTLHYQRK